MMKTANIANYRQKGAALVLAVLAMSLLMVMGGALLNLGLQSRTYQVRTSSDITARCAADAALTKAIYDINLQLQAKQLNPDDLPQQASTSFPGTDAGFAYQITRQGSDYIVEGIGTSQVAQRTVQAKLQLTGPFEFAIFAEEDVTMNNSSEIDWYNNDAGDSPLKVGTNSTNNGAIDLKNSIDIYGDVVVGPGGNPSTVISEKNGSEIHGNKSAQTKENTLKSVTVPSGLQSASSKGKIKNSGTITTSGKYDEIDLGNNEQLIIRGDVDLYVTGDITLGNNAKIDIDDDVPNSALVLYLGGDFEGKNGSDINNETEVPKKLKIFGLDTCKKLRFKNSSDFYGAIYAPEADIIVDNSADMYGAVVGKSLDLKNGVDLYYDASLRDVTENDELVRFKVKRWQE